MSDGRGTSVALNYILSLAIVTVLIAGLFVGMADVVRTEREAAITSEFDVLGNRLAADVATVDRLAQTTTGTAETVELRTAVPGRVGGTGYTVTIESTERAGGEYYDVTITLKANGLPVDRTVHLRTEHEVANTTFSGGQYAIVYNGTALEVNRE